MLRKVTIPTYSRDKYIEFKAYLEEKSVHLGKWVTILFPFIAIAISVISLIANGEPTEQSILKLEIAGILILGIAALAIVKMESVEKHYAIWKNIFKRMMLLRKIKMCRNRK